MVIALHGLRSGVPAALLSRRGKAELLHILARGRPTGMAESHSTVHSNKASFSHGWHCHLRMRMPTVDSRLVSLTPAVRWPAELFHCARCRGIAWAEDICWYIPRQRQDFANQFRWDSRAG